MPAVFQDKFRCTSRAQASEQEWQPMQRSILGAVRIFKEGSYQFRMLDTGCGIRDRE
jgi:hypothetical protein